MHLLSHRHYVDSIYKIRRDLTCDRKIPISLSRVNYFAHTVMILCYEVTMMACMLSSAASELLSELWRRGREQREARERGDSCAVPKPAS